MTTTNFDWPALYRSPIGKKLLTGVTGLGLTLFVLIHMGGNLIFFSSPAAYNQYAHFLEGLGPLLYLLEGVLMLALGLHAVLGIQMFIENRKARPVAYTQYASRGWPSLQSLSSRTMAVTGPILLIFLVTHLLTFKYGTYYTTVVAGVEMRDLARLLTETFQSPFYAFGYVGVMAVLGFHLRHGFWSALQSLGLMQARLKPLVYGMGLGLAIVLAVGFMVLPVYIWAFL